MEIEVADKGLKRHRKCTRGASSLAAKKEAKYSLENWFDKGHLAPEFPAIRDKVREWGLGYIFAELEECNLTLVREFYDNWDTSYGEKMNLRSGV
ncbi:hypothetical protein HAX54_024057, partial [Datura stramonium]|nr:hypothetical protein [Datura stramonium]